MHGCSVAEQAKGVASDCEVAVLLIPGVCVMDNHDLHRQTQIMFEPRRQFVEQ